MKKVNTHSHPPVWSQWDEEEVFYEKNLFFDSVLERIERAEHYIEFETYLFEEGHLGRQLLAAFKRASARGVCVRFLVDGVGSFFALSFIETELRGSRVKFHIYHPFKLITPLSKLNKRLHRKVILIDRQIAFVGSFNVIAENQRDTGMKVRGESVLILLRSFEKTWRTRWFRKRLLLNRHSLVRINDTRMSRKYFNHDLVARLQSAKKRVWVTNPYFVPPMNLLRAFCETAERGVDTCIIVPAHSDHRMMKWLAQGYYKALLKSGVRILEYEPRFIHAKTILIDDWATVGTSNFNHRSLIHDLEVDLVVTKSGSMVSLHNQFEMDANESLKITTNSINKSFFLFLFLRWCISFFRSWS